MSIYLERRGGGERKERRREKNRTKISFISLNNILFHSFCINKAIL